MSDDHIVYQRRIEPILTPRIVVTLIAFSILFAGILVSLAG